MNVKPTPAPLDPELEYATLQRDDGTPVPRTAALRSLAKFREALRKAGGKAPLDSRGRPMAWRSDNVWVPQSAPVRTGGLSMADAQRQQERVTLELEEAAAARRGETTLGLRLHAQRRARHERERQAAERRDRDATELYIRASAGALEFMRMFNLGRYLSRDPSLDEMTGKQLAVAFNGYVPLEARAARQARLARVSR
jgi:hypothetical protein